MSVIKFILMNVKKLTVSISWTKKLTYVTLVR